jgi:hypothetical protein
MSGSLFVIRFDYIDVFMDYENDDKGNFGAY